MKKKRPSLLRYFTKNLLIVISLVLIWRGVWYVLDYVDLVVFKGEHVFTSVGGILLGLLILYVPDKDLKEIEKL